MVAPIIQANGPLSRLYQLEKQLRTWGALSELLAWDESTYLPPSAVEHRAQVKAFVASEGHALLISDEFGKALAEAEKMTVEAGSWDAADLREWKIRRKRAVALPPALVSRLAQATTEARNIWVQAKKENRFQDFIEPLNRVIDLKREEASHLADGGDSYEALIRLWEPGIERETLDRLFGELRHPIAKLFEELSGKAHDTAHLLEGNVSVAAQKRLGEEIAARIGFDFRRGRIDETAHPFCMRLGPDDVRLTTRYSEKHFSQSFFTILHEAGHGLYEQGIPQDAYYRPSGTYCSLGIHESQSRLWENGVGRSREFWEYCLPLLRAAYGNWQNTTLDEFVLAVNRVSPTLIRVESDEVSYNLHIMIRYEIESELISGALAVKDIPERWNESYRQTLKVIPASDSEGCLQDIHWSCGMFGYFPTYTLGNLYAAQLLNQAAKDIPGLRGGFREGKFLPLTKWLKENVHASARRYSAEDLCKKLTGRGVSTEPFLQYLSEKFRPMYASR